MRHICDVFQEAASQFGNFAPASGKADLAALPVKQFLADFFSKKADLPVYRRMRDVQALPGLCVTARLHDGQEHLQLAEFHARQCIKIRTAKSHHSN
jgi:hypothetical protein